MMLLLNWRVWVAVALLAGLSFTHFTAYRAGKQNVRTQWDLAKATANEDARKLEQQRQRRADDAGKIAAKRRVVLVADAAVARTELDGLRNDIIATEPTRDESRAAADQRASTLGELLQACSRAYQELAATADRHASDVRMLLDAWPK